MLSQRIRPATRGVTNDRHGLCGAILIVAAIHRRAWFGVCFGPASSVSWRRSALSLARAEGAVMSDYQRIWLRALLALLGLIACGYSLFYRPPHDLTWTWIGGALLLLSVLAA